MNDQLPMTESLACTLASLDPSTRGHCQRVQRLSRFIGKDLGLSSSELMLLALGSLLHDVGKKYVPQGILLKETSLSTDDWMEIQQHPVYGWEYARENVLNQEVQEIILHHHLWFDGRGGYPSADPGVRPSHLTQIASVADVVDAMTQDRPYRKALSLDVSLDFLNENSGTQFCPAVVKSVLQNLSQVKLELALA